MHFLGYKINIIFLFCNAEMAKFALFRFKTAFNGIFLYPQKIFFKKNCFVNYL
jgi:hypothetical protein